MTTIEVKKLILSALPGAEVDVNDMTGTGDHFDVMVASKAFTGKSMIDQHRMVFAAFEGHMDDAIHAVKLKTRLPNS